MVADLTTNQDLANLEVESDVFNISDHHNSIDNQSSNVHNQDSNQGVS